jgi:hypothetical protein
MNHKLISLHVKMKSKKPLTVHGLLMHLIDAFVLVDSIEKLLVRLLNHSDLVIIINEVAKLFEICWKGWILGQAG